jgi:hypothetical protein
MVQKSWLAALCALSLVCGCSDNRPDAPDADVSDARGADLRATDVAGDDLPAPDLGLVDAGADLSMVPGPDTPLECSGVKAWQEDDVLVLDNGVLVVRYRLTEGLFDVATASGDVLLVNAESRATLFPGAPGGTVYRASLLPFKSWEGECWDSSPLGPGTTVLVRRVLPNQGTMITILSLLEASTYLLSSMGIYGDAEMKATPFKELSPLVADSDTGGGLFIGQDPYQHMVVDNGSDMYFDFAARVYRVGKGNSVWFAGRGGVSNWNTALYDPDSGRSVTAGFLSFGRGIGLIANDYQPADALEDNGRKGFTRFEGFVRFDPFRGWDDAGEGWGRIYGELFYVDFLAPTPFDGLERYASRYAQYHEKKLWTDIPTGWNSWGGGGGEGGLGTNINEEILNANLQAMLEDFAPWGMKYFLVDNGWEVVEGDWQTNTERFPPHEGMDGMAYLAQKVKDAGLIPGIWVAPFWVKSNSKLAQEHPDWLVPKNELAGFLMSDTDETLDLANPEVLEWLHDLMTRLTQEWGYQWIKLDFSYYALFADELYGGTQSAAEAYHNAMAVIRDAIGPETFFVGISAMGLCFDTVDGGRTTLDNMPTWGDDDDQGIKITLRTAAHRYYLNWLWSNHHDLVFYRPTIGLTLNEARAWTSVVSLMGGIVKLGDPYTMMHDHPDWLAMARKIIPVYPHSARPLDMFQLLHPEVWHLPVTRAGRHWDVVGLFNWGTNVAVATGQDVPEETRTKKLDLATVGLGSGDSYLAVSMWDLTCDWIHDGVLEATLEPRTEAVFVVRPQAGEPAIVATDRHLMGGAVEVEDEWVTATDDGYLLSATIKQPAGHALNVLMDGAGLDAVAVVSPVGATIMAGPCEGTWLLQVTPSESPVQLEVRYE